MNTQQPESLRLAYVFDHPIPPEWSDMVAAASELRRLYAENETLQQGYDAARLEIESLRDEVKEYRHGAGVQKALIETLLADKPAGEYPALPEWSKMDNLGGLVPSEIRQELRAYVDADRAMRAQEAPAAGERLGGLRDQFELAYATAWAAERKGDETPQELAVSIRTWRDGDTYPDDLPRLRFGWEAYQWAAFAAAPTTQAAPVAQGDALDVEIAALESSCAHLGRLIDELRPDAERYQYLRERDLDTIRQGGVFAGRTPDNVVLNGDDLDAAIDAARSAKEGASHD